ncbi:unnamed protein product [Oppiella nova]|uniref:Uncharacterized protein n=1 Tax=Oppiella nova TaxID=334625 RepID=A0A7R9MK94_9ACAR|nr:unnamed protein product [Oppiella nova]CAG2178805.1 unnamed protein product [Oppiella nova]
MLTKDMRRLYRKWPTVSKPLLSMNLSKATT